MFKEVWKKHIRFNWVFGTILIFALGIPRFILVLNANVSGKFNYISIIFLIMWVLPFIFLSRKGKKYIGLVKPKNRNWIVYSFLIGALTSLTVYLIGFLLFKNTYQNWFVYLAKPFEMYSDISSSDKLILFTISAIIAMTFSPIGEEIFYRGMIHGSFQINFGDTKASYVDSLAFALTHLAHFGIVFINSEWEFLIFPSVLWVTLMFFTSRLFFLCRKKSGSIFGAIISHSAFNLVMTYIIFYELI